MAKVKPKTKKKALPPGKKKAAAKKKVLKSKKARVPGPAPSVRITMPAFGSPLVLDPTGTYQVSATHTLANPTSATSWIVLDGSTGAVGTVVGTLVSGLASPVQFSYPTDGTIPAGGNHVLYVRIDDGYNAATDDILVQGPPAMIVVPVPVPVPVPGPM